MRHECKITVLETKVFQSIRSDIWQTPGWDPVSASKKGTPSF